MRRTVPTAVLADRPECSYHRTMSSDETQVTPVLHEEPDAGQDENAGRRRRLASALSQQKELREAQEAATTALYRMNEALDRLRSARSWGSYDTWLGGGFVSSLIKRDKVDRARQLMQSSNQALEKLRAELLDVGLDGVGDVEIGRLHRTLDAWFDNIISDVRAQSRIKEAAGRIEDMVAHVVRLQSELTRRERAVSADLRRLVGQAAGDAED
jgi:hypothetical protein